MTTISRIRTTLTGFPGGPGVSTMYSTNTGTIVASVHTFWAAMAAVMPTDVQIQVQADGDLLEDTTGALTGAWSATPVGVITGGANGAYAAPCGALVEWLSATIFAGHRVRGRTFVVPLGGQWFQSDGSLAPTIPSGLKAAADALVVAEAGGFCIWNRPRRARAANGTIPAVTARAGAHALVTSSRVPDKAVVLRSRRD